VRTREALVGLAGLTLASQLTAWGQQTQEAVAIFDSDTFSSAPSAIGRNSFEQVTELMKSGAPNLKELREALDLRFDTVRTLNVAFP
jgi:hypothetical protein